MPPSAVPLPTGPSARRARRRVAVELALGLLLGVVLGWLAGLVQVRPGQGRHP